MFLSSIPSHNRMVAWCSGVRPSERYILHTSTSAVVVSFVYWVGSCIFLFKHKRRGVFVVSLSPIFISRPPFARLQVKIPCRRRRGSMRCLFDIIKPEFQSNRTGCNQIKHLIVEPRRRYTAAVSDNEGLRQRGSSGNHE